MVKSTETVAQVFRLCMKNFTQVILTLAVWEYGFLVWTPEALIQFSLKIGQQVKYTKYLTWCNITVRDSDWFYRPKTDLQERHVE